MVNQDEKHVAAVDATLATEADLRPDFSAEALSPRFRRGLFATTLIGVVASMASVFAMAEWPSGPLELGDGLGVMLVALLVALTFFIFMIYGALVGNNQQLSGAQRLTWYVFFIFAGPVALPAYWLVHVRSAPFIPLRTPV